jgi:hypothetical protein
MYFRPLSEKAIKRRNEELIALHKRVIKTYLVQCGLKLKYRRQFFKLYDMTIEDTNILCWFFTPTPLFVRALVIGGEELLKARTYIFKE